MLARGGPYQASSIHSRRRLSFSSRIARSERGREVSPSAPSPQPPPLPSATQENNHSIRNARERRLLSDLWLMSAATFRRLENLDQTRGAIQEAEMLDEENEAVWVQVRTRISLEDSKTLIDQPFSWAYTFLHGAKKGRPLKLSKKRSSFHRITYLLPSIYANYISPLLCLYFARARMAL